MRLNRFALPVVLMTVAVQVRAGDLNVVGNMDVASNLTAKGVTLGGQNRTNWPSPGGSSGAIQFGQSGAFGADQYLKWDGTNGLQITIPAPPIWRDKAIRVYCQRPNSGNDFIAAYNASSDLRWLFSMLPDESLRFYSALIDTDVLRLNTNGVGVLTPPAAGQALTVAGDAWVYGDVAIDGKLNAYGGMDPPYLLLDSGTRAGIARRVAREVAPSKQTGAALFWNGQTKRLEIYVASEGAFYNLAGNLITNIAPPAIAGKVVARRLTIDADTGAVVTNESQWVPRWQLKAGYRFNRLTGEFTYQAGSNAPPVAVSRDEAIELR